MEPGHEDREYVPDREELRCECGPQWSPVMKTGNTTLDIMKDYRMMTPQWSPVMKTGNTSPAGPASRRNPPASMEPGHEDREYGGQPTPPTKSYPASMEPGHEDREYLSTASSRAASARLNGARS